MVFIMWVLSIIAPIFTLMGFFVIGFMLVPETGFITFGDVPIWCWIVAGVLAIFGFIIGFKNWELYQAPREFWRKSKVDLLSTRFSISTSLCFSFFCIVPDICFIMSFF